MTPFQKVETQVVEACKKSARNPHDVLILAVSKMQPVEKIESLIPEGVQSFGENYVQELLEKRQHFEGKNLQWHLIGHLQSNKVNQIGGLCTLIHSVDSLKLARKLGEKAVAENRNENILLQVNLAGEESKEGLSCEEVRRDWKDYVTTPGIRIHGLMTMPPLQNQPEENRPHFRALRELCAELKKEADVSRHPLNHLSMGTSHDFVVAVEEGATIIRVGSILFGARPG